MSDKKEDTGVEVSDNGRRKFLKVAAAGAGAAALAACGKEEAPKPVAGAPAVNTNKPITLKMQTSGAHLIFGRALLKTIVIVLSACLVVV